MPRALVFVLFFIVATTLLVGWHYYLWARLVRDPGWPERIKKTGKVVFVLLAFGLIVVMLVGRVFPSDAMRPISLLGFGWLGTSFMMVVCLLVLDLMRLGAWGARRVAKQEALDAEKRRTLSRIVAGATLSTGALGAAYGAATALGTIPIERVRVPLRRLSKSMSGTTIAQLSDMHVGPTLQKEWVDGVVKQVNVLEPDMIVITGDLVDGSVKQLRDHVAPLAQLKARYGVYFVTGNHEYYSGANAWIEELTRMGIRVLRNERVSIGDGSDSFDLAGVDDWSSSRMEEGHGHDIVSAMRDADPNREVVLLSHQPRSIHEAAENGIGLQLSGHTHGGQIYPWYYAVFLQQPFVAGLHQVKNTWLYVNRGTGFWGPPIRVGAPPEISLIELVQQA